MLLQTQLLPTGQQLEGQECRTVWPSVALTRAPLPVDAARVGGHPGAEYMCQVLIPHAQGRAAGPYSGFPCIWDLPGSVAQDGSFSGPPRTHPTVPSPSLPGMTRDSQRPFGSV